MIESLEWTMEAGGSGAACFEVEIWADTAKFTNVIVAGFRKCRDWSEKVRCSSKIKQRLRAEWVVCERGVMYFRKLFPIRRNSGLEELRVRRFAR